jgi:Cu/Ag efflux protein CusF
MVRTRTLTAVACVMVLGAGTLGPVQRGVMTAWAQGESKPSVSEARTVTVRGTIEAVDKENRTVTLKGQKGRTLTLAVKDPQKLEALKVGDPVVARYYESIMIQVRKPGEATPGVTTQQARVSSKPGEAPGGAIGQEVTVTATITAIDTKAGTVTIKGPQGRVETVKARDPKNLAKVKVGDLVEITYTEALAVALDKPVKK